MKVEKEVSGVTGDRLRLVEEAGNRLGGLLVVKDPGGRAAQDQGAQSAWLRREENRGDVRPGILCTKVRVPCARPSVRPKK